VLKLEQYLPQAGQISMIAVWRIVSPKASAVDVARFTDRPQEEPATRARGLSTRQYARL